MHTSNSSASLTKYYHSFSSSSAQFNNVPKLQGREMITLRDFKSRRPSSVYSWDAPIGPDPGPGTSVWQRAERGSRTTLTVPELRRDNCADGVWSWHRRRYF